LPSGELRLISEEPTTSMIWLTGAKGYNNAVKLIDDFCGELYGNTSLASNVQSLKIEDIESKMNLGTCDYHSYVGTYQYGNYGAELSSSKRYPNVFYNEDGQKVNGATHGSVGLSDTTSYTNVDNSGGEVKPTGIPIGSNLNKVKNVWDLAGNTACRTCKASANANRWHRGTRYTDSETYAMRWSRCDKPGIVN